MINRRAQTAIEFLVLIGAMLFIFLTFLYVFQNDVAKKSYEKRDFEINELALNIQNELSIAAAASDGFQRGFSVPDEILGRNYTIQLVANSVYIITEDGAHAVSLEVQNVTGQIRKGDNFIRKVDGEVLLN